MSSDSVACGSPANSINAGGKTIKRLLTAVGAVSKPPSGSSKLSRELMGYIMEPLIFMILSGRGWTNGPNGRHSISGMAGDNKLVKQSDVGQDLF